MRATVMHAPGDVRVEDVPDARIEQPTDALVRITASCICGSDLHPYHSMPAGSGPVHMGHEFIGVVEEVGSEVRTLTKGDLVIAPFAFSCGECEFCRAGLHTACAGGGGFWDMLGGQGGQSEAIRVPLADGTLFTVPGPVDEALVPSLLTLSDVYGTGYHAAKVAGVRPGDTVTVVGDGAVGLLAVLSAKQLGAEQVVLMGRHTARTDLGREYGATDVVAERGQEGIEKVRELTGGGSSYAIDTTAVPAVVKQGLQALRSRGTMVALGLGADEYPVDATDLLQGGKRLMSSLEGDSDPREMVPRMIDMRAAGTLDLDPLVTTYPFAEINTAVADVLAGKVVKPVLVW